MAVKFASQDPDSQVYAEISARLGGLPVRTWIAPQWWGLWNLEGPYLEHPVGVFLVPALLAKTGFPPLQAAFAVGALCSLIFLQQLRRVASLIIADRRAAIVPWVAPIIPAAFINRIRATQEYPVLVLILLAIYATEKSRRIGQGHRVERCRVCTLRFAKYAGKNVTFRSSGSEAHDRHVGHRHSESTPWMAVSILVACATVLVKGMFVVFVPNRLRLVASVHAGERARGPSRVAWHRAQRGVGRALRVRLGEPLSPRHWPVVSRFLPVVSPESTRTRQPGVRPHGLAHAE